MVACPCTARSIPSERPKDDPGSTVTVRKQRTETFPICIIGAGFGGIAAAVKLKRAGFHDLTVFEQSEGPGGTWWDNTYPGAEVDVSSYLYSYSFKAFGWSRTHAGQAELQHYLEEVIDDFELRDCFRFRTRVERVVWHEARGGYEVHLVDQETQFFRAVISAVGLLNVPRYPSWPGLNDFRGPHFHTARWEHKHDLAGRTVAVVGTGSTASQVVPALAGTTGRIVLFQREPGWVLPKGDRDFTEEERHGFRDRRTRRRERLRLFWQYEKGQLFGAIHRPGTKVNALRESQCRAYIAAVFKNRPELAALVTPSYPYPGKRPILTGTFYPTLLRDDVELVPHAVQSVTERGVVDAAGTEHPVDVLVYATGFQPANYLASFEVRGRDGTTLQETWNGEPEAFLGITVHGFPNFYILYGPNTNGGEIVSHLERQAEYAVRSIARVCRHDLLGVDVRVGFQRRYNRWVQRAIAKTAWVRSQNYYKAESGRVVTQWPYGVIIYSTLTRLLGWPSERRIPRPRPKQQPSPRSSAAVPRDLSEGEQVHV